MKRLPPAKRNQLIIVVVATVALIGLVYSLLIGPQNLENSRLANETKAAKVKLDQYRTTIKQADVTASELADITYRLGHAEEDIATGDVYAWTYDTIRRFKATYHVDIPDTSKPTAGEVDLLADFPYKQVKVTLNGSGYYHDLGKFVADFENNFPHMRVVNLMIEPAGALPGTAAERLSFRMDIVALVRPNN